MRIALRQAGSAPSTGRQLDAALGLHRAEFARLVVPGPCHRDVGCRTTDAEFLQGDRIVGRAECQGRAGIAGLGGAPQQHPSGRDVADRDEFVGTLDERCNRLGIRPGRRLSRQRRDASAQLSTTRINKMERVDMTEICCSHAPSAPNSDQPRIRFFSLRTAADRWSGRRDAATKRHHGRRHRGRAVGPRRVRGAA